MTNQIDLNAAKSAKASDRKALAILAYDNATADDPANANWRGIAELLRLAIPNSKAKAETAPADSRYAQWADYPIPHNVSGKRLGKSPVCVVTFADGEIVRVPAVSLPGKPLNAGRALRVAVSYYQSRKVSHYKDSIPDEYQSWIGAYGSRLSVTDSEFLATIPIPAVSSFVCETTGAEYDPATCSELVSRRLPVAPFGSLPPVAPSRTEPPLAPSFHVPARFMESTSLQFAA